MKGAELQLARLALLVSGPTLAEALGVSVRTIRAWESDAREIPRGYQVLIRLAVRSKQVRDELGLAQAAEGRQGPRPSRG